MNFLGIMFDYCRWSIKGWENKGKPLQECLHRKAGWYTVDKYSPLGATKCNKNQWPLHFLHFTFLYVNRIKINSNGGQNEYQNKVVSKNSSVVSMWSVKSDPWSVNQINLFTITNKNAWSPRIWKGPVVDLGLHNTGLEKGRSPAGNYSEKFIYTKNILHDNTFQLQGIGHNIMTDMHINLLQGLFNHWRNTKGSVLQVSEKVYINHFFKVSTTKMLIIIGCD